jgi:glucose/arabinose dehydrogenase
VKARLLSVLLAGTLAAPLIHTVKAEVLSGKNAFGDWTTDRPGVTRRITVADLPPPNATKSAKNQPKLVDRPEGAVPQVPAGFQVREFAGGFKQPRVMVTAPNGDIFLADSKANQVHLLRDADGDGAPELNEVFLTDLKQPFGIAFHPLGPEPKHVYIANTDAVVRVPYQNGQTKSDAKPEKVVELSGGGQLTGGGHWTRDIVFSRDGNRLFTAVGSKSNNNDDEAEKERARILVCDPNGQNLKPYATGIRNPVGLAIHPKTGELWTSVNERDELGDDLVPDYITRVKEGGFYGWPWFYLGPNEDPKHAGKHPELRDKVLNPDVIIQAHSASLDLAFYDGMSFPEEYRLNAFAAEHGSWNRERRTGYKVIRVPNKDGVPTGEYVDFMTGFVTPEGNVWGRPVGLTVTKQGSLLVSDDGGKRVWIVGYTGAK